NLMLEYPHDLVGNAVEADVFPERVQAREKLLLRVGADYSDAGVGEVVGLAEEGAFGDVHLAHAAIRGIHAADAVVRAARAVGDHAIFERFRRNVFQQWDFSADGVKIVDREPNLRSGFRASSL